MHIIQSESEHGIGPNAGLELNIDKQSKGDRKTHEHHEHVDDTD